MKGIEGRGDEGEANGEENRGKREASGMGVTKGYVWDGRDDSENKRNKKKIYIE